MNTSPENEKIVNKQVVAPVIASIKPRKRRRVVATPLQAAAIERVIKHKEAPSVAMLKVGYTPGSAKNPKILTGSGAWETLMEKSIPDSLLAEKHRALLNKREVIVKNNPETGKPELIPTKEIDVHAVGKGLEMAYKLKGRFPKETNNTNVNVNISLAQLFVASKKEPDNGNN